MAVSCEDTGEHFGSLKATGVVDRPIACHYVTIHSVPISIPLSSCDCTFLADPPLYCDDNDRDQRHFSADFCYVFERS